MNQNENPLRVRAVPTMSVVPATTTPEQNRARVYGWDKVIWSAKNDPVSVVKTPEAYMLFAMAVYYTQINKRGLQFSYGYGLYFGEHASDD